MNKSKFYLLGLLLAVGLVGCGEKEAAKPETATNVEVKQFEEPTVNLEKKVIKKGEATDAKEVTLNFAATSDVHGRIYPYEYASDSEVSNQGYAKTYTIVKGLREKNPNLVLIDVGDAVQDNSVELFNSLETHPMVQAMNSMSYDVWVLGNHEFNFDKDFLLRNINNFKGSVVSSNIINEKDGSRFVLPYQLFEIDGVRVAVVGGVPPHIPMWEASTPEHFKGLKFEDPKDAVKTTLDELKGKYDVLVGAFHLGRHDEYGKTGVFDLAKMYPEFNVIFAGHEHAKYVTDVEGTTVLEPGAYGWGVSTSEIKLAKEDGKWIVKDVKTENIETKNVEASQEILDEFKFVHEKSQENANKIIGKVAERFIDRVDYITGADKVTTMPTAQMEDNAIIELINTVQKFYTKADIAGAALFKPETNLQAGDFKVKDTSVIYKHANTLMGVNMTGENLLKYMEWSARYYNQSKPGDVTISFNPEVRGYNYDMFEGVNYQIDISKPEGERIVNATVNGEAIDPKKTYKVAVNNYRFGTLMNLGLITAEDKYYDSYEDLQDAGRVRDLITRYVNEELGGVLTPKVDNNWKIIGVEDNVPGKEEVIKKIISGEITIPTSSDGRTVNVKSININEL